MSDYLPLSAFRYGLLPGPCRTCVWWQTVGNRYCSDEVSREKRRQWMAYLEATWGTSGLLLEAAGGPTKSTPAVTASINFAPATAVPRLDELPVSALPENATLLLCLMVTEGHPNSQAKRLIQKALGHLRTRGVEEVYALARLSDEIDDPNPCRFFRVDPLADNGFREVGGNDGLILMQADLRGLLALVDLLETMIRRALHKEPAPSPAAWTHRGA